MNTVTSADGTKIAYDRAGQGPPLILVDGALCHRGFGPMKKIAALLTPHFTVITYDRRGRGESGNGTVYGIEREIEDIAALLSLAGGSANVFGTSSGAALALEAANHGLRINRLALYEAPFIVDDGRTAISADYLPNLKRMIAENRRSDAVKSFMKFVGAPALMVGIMPVVMFPVWAKLKAVAHTLPYDISIVAPYETGRPLPPNRWPNASMPILVADGGKSPAWMRNAMRSLSENLPTSHYQTLDGQTHMVKPHVLAPALINFFNS